MGRNMINYSIFMWKNPLIDDAEEKAYAKNQVTKVMSFDEFVAHISSHNGVFSRGTVKGVHCEKDCILLQYHKYSFWYHPFKNIIEIA